MNDKTKKYLKYGFNTAILIGVIMAANKYLNGEEVFNALKDFNYTYAPYMLLIALGFLFIKAWRLAILVRPISDVPFWTMFEIYVAGQAMTVLPGGIAARA